MLSYIARRLLLMIPTLIGITFLIFMLVALSPGGIGAALRAAGGTMQADVGSRAVQEAYLQDRYGLDDPAPLQYIRWLGRISPLKFGERAQRTPQGEIVLIPRGLKEPPLWEWFTERLPAEPSVQPAALAAGENPEAERAARLRQFQTASAANARARLRYVGERAGLEQALGRYATAAGRGDLVDFRGVPDADALGRLKPDRASPAWAEAEEQGKKTLAAYEAALASRAALLGVIRAKPFEEIGFPIIPGVLSIGPPDFGSSFTRGQPVVDLITSALPVTLLLNLIAFPLIYLVAIPTGILAATKQGRWQDTAIGGLVVALWSIPTVWAGVLCMGYLASDQYLGAFPVSGLHATGSEAFTFLPSAASGKAGWHHGYLLDVLWHICLPVFCLVYGGFAVLSKQTRAAMLDNFNADYVRTAKAKGVDGRTIVFAHVFRNSLLPLITMFATIFPAMLSGSVVIERIFTVPGMGSLIIDSINLRDREVLLANTLMIAAVNLLALLLADILYAAADPRISYK
ncbi:MAG: ABC transporter permease [Phycisphaerales bacterium]|nr:ABC transporter permease [Phycisphaerales bacterium]